MKADNELIEYITIRHERILKKSDEARKKHDLTTYNYFVGVAAAFKEILDIVSEGE